MNPSNHGIELLVAAAGDYAPRRAGDGLARLDALDLFVDLRALQTMDAGVMAAFISEITASTREGRRGITVTCVGRGGDVPSAVGDAVAQWTLGVLPVLAHWRGKHSCFTTSAPLETGGGPFELLAGPVIERGRSEGEAPPAAGGARLVEAVRDVVRGERPAQRLHWLELFTCKLFGGSVEATCRYDNRDWAPGQEILRDIAAAWPTTPEPMQSSRQFALLVPEHGDAREIVVPTFWSRLFGRA